MTLLEQGAARPTDRVDSDLLPAIAAIVRIDPGSAMLRLVGTDLWGATDGHLGVHDPEQSADQRSDVPTTYNGHQLNAYSPIRAAGGP